MPLPIALNGFGRIGRLVLRNIVKRSEFSVVAINDLADPEGLAYLFRHDSVHGRYPEGVRREENKLFVAGNAILLLAERDAARLPWKDLGVRVVIDASGAYRERAKAAKHLEAGAEKVVITAPAKDPDATICIGVNTEVYDPKRHHIVSNASCTTNALAPIAMVLDETFSLERGFINTVHAYTTSQALVDVPARKLRRGRAAALNLVPTSTGAAEAVGLVLPKLQGRLDGLSIRSPNPDGSLLDLTAILGRPATPEEVNEALRKAAESDRLRGILSVTDEELVSTDIIGDCHSSVVDAGMTMTLGNLVKVLAWYDNEWGYSSRVVDLVGLIASKMVGG